MTCGHLSRRFNPRGRNFSQYLSSRKLRRMLKWKPRFDLKRGYPRRSNGTMNSWAQNNQPLSGKRVFVTGAAGFIGSQLARALLACGCRVSVLLRRSSDCWRLRDILPQLKIHYGDLSSLSFEEARAGLSSSDMIFHLAAAGIDAGKPDAEAILKTNVLGTLTLLKLARHWNVERFINCGSCSEYGKGHFWRKTRPWRPSAVRRFEGVRRGAG